jgi:hypothetical protein
MVRIQLFLAFWAIAPALARGAVFQHFYIGGGINVNHSVFLRFYANGNPRRLFQNIYA